MPSSRRLFAATLLVFALALLLRTLALGAFLPHRAEGDASYVVQSELLRADEPHPERNPEFGRYPLLIPYIDQLVPFSSPEDPQTLDQHLYSAARGHLRIRWIVALLSSAIVPATWALARIFMGPRGALFAAFLSATSLLHLAFSQQARPHASSVPFVILAVVACVHLSRRGSRGEYLRAGVLVGLALGTLQSALALMGPLAVAHALVLRRHGVQRFARIGWSLVPIVLCFVAFYPFIFSPSSGGDGAALRLEGNGVLQQSGHLVFLNLFNGRGLATIARTLWHYEPISIALALLGILALARRRRVSRATKEVRGDLLVVLAHALPYALAVCLYQRSLERFAIPLLPYVALLAATGAHAACNGIRSRSIRRTVGSLLVLGPLVLAAQHARVRCTPDTVSQAAGWIESHLEPESPIAVLLPIDLPLAWSAEALAWNTPQPVPGRMRYPWLAHVASHPQLPGPRWNLRWLPVLGLEERELARKNPYRPVRATGGEYLVLEHFARGRHDPLLERIASWAERNAELLARFSPGGETPSHPTALSYVAGPRRAPPPHYAWRLLQAEAFGPVVEIYRVPEPPAVRAQER